MVESVAVLVLNYNGADLLPIVVPAIVRMADRASVPVRIIIVDNSSTDASIEWLADNHPDIHVVVKPNEYLFSLNGVAAQDASSHLLVMNNDVVPEEDSLDRLLAHFECDEVFAVSPKLLRWDKTTPNSGRRVGAYVNGFFHHWQEFEPELACPTLFPVGAAFLVRRDRFAEIGGFDRLYWPCFYEDVDLGYQAWMRGWTVIYEPDAVMYHRTSPTLDRYQTSAQQRIVEVRNNLLYVWKNSDAKTFRHHWLKLARRLTGAVKRHEGEFLRCFFAAVSRWRLVKNRRRSLRSARVRGDSEIYRLVSGAASLEI